jgi:hypothetical protein
LHASIRRARDGALLAERRRVISQNRPHRIVTISAAIAVALVAPACTDSQSELDDRADVTITHAFDFASAMPSHLAVMFSMSWFGIPSSDPQGGGPDPSYGNAKWGGGCVATSDPATCSTCILKGASDTCIMTGPPQRAMASRRRMLAGIYSASALDTEGKARTDLMLSGIRRACDSGANLDAWTMQMNGLRDTPLHATNPTCSTCKIAYDAALGFLAEADAGGMTNTIIPGDDATWYFHFGSGVGLGKCDDSAGNPKQSCIAALTQDFVDMSNMSAAHASGLKLHGKPVIYVYFDSSHLTVAQWQSLLQNARNQSGRDFYVIASTQNPSATTYFGAFDAMSPWINLTWNNYSGATVRQHAFNWAAGLHGALHSAVATYSGRALFGAMTPGFDDFTMSWGQCLERQLPPGDPRDPEVLLGEFDYFKSVGMTGLVGQTWDDWTEGTNFEPDVAGSTATLIEMRQQLAGLFGYQADPAGDAQLTSRWESYGQARNCDGGSASTPPVTKLSCDCPCTTTHFTQSSNTVAGGWNPANEQLLADVDGDGKRDLVILWNNGSAFAQVSKATGTGFQQVSNAAVGAWNPTTRNLVGDVDHDGKQDLVRVYQAGTSAYAQVWQSTGSGFQSVSNASIGGWDPTYVDLVMDVDGDGKRDLVVLWNNGQTTAQVSTSNGTGFARVSNTSLGVTWSTADRFLVGDVDGNGKQDLVRLHQVGTSTYAQVFVSNGTTFTSVSDASIGGWDPTYVDLLGDFDGDGKADLLVVWNNAGATTAQLSLSNATGFARVSNAATGVAWRASSRYFLGDADGDGRQDLVTVYPNGVAAYAQVATSNGLGFVQTSNAAVGGWSSAWVDELADVSGDGKADLLVFWQDTTQPAGQDARAQVTLASCP